VYCLNAYALYNLVIEFVTLDLHLQLLHTRATNKVIILFVWLAWMNCLSQYASNLGWLCHYF
jgi:hypothetical protein